MNKKSIIEIWQSQQFSETDITKAFNITHRDLRILLQRHDIAVPEAVPHSMKLEIYRDMSDDTLHKIAKDYGIGPGTVCRWRKSVPLIDDEHTASKDDILRYHEKGYTDKEIMDALDVSYYRVRKALSTCRKAITPELIASIQEDLANGMYQTDIAAKYGVAPATVSKYNPNRRTQERRQALDDDTWANLKAHLERYTLSEVARMFNVTRPYIYARLNKEKAT